LADDEYFKEFRSFLKEVTKSPSTGTYVFDFIEIPIWNN